MCVIIWDRNGQRNEVLIPSPQSSASLARTMFNNHRVGYSEIRAVKAVNPSELIPVRI